jgi:hypothetical protein
MNRKRISVAVVSLLLMGSTLAMAEGFGGPPSGSGNMKPPAEAIEACKDKNEGDAVEFNTPRGDKLKAVCKKNDNQLVAVPEGAFRGPEGGNRQ